MDSDDGGSGESLELTPDEILAGIDAPFGELPVRAIRAAQKCQDRVIPGLVQLIERDIQESREGREPARNGCFFALFLLIEFRATEAFETIVRAVSLPDDLPFQLFGDGIHEALPLAVPALAEQRLDEVLTLIRNRELNEYVRWALQTGLVHLVAGGLRSREEIVGYLRAILLEAIENEDAEAVLAAVHSLHDLYPEETYDDIQRAYALGLVDEFMISPHDFDRQLTLGKDRVLQGLQEKSASIQDTVEMLRHWAAFMPQNPKPTVNPTPRTPSPRPLPKPDPMPANVEPRVGRNEPCPCGSGKKFKSKKTRIGSLIASAVSIFGCGKPAASPKQAAPEPILIEEISVVGFDHEGEPIIKKWSDGSIWIHFEAMPPFFSEDEGTEADFENFEAKIQQTLGVPVRRDDREVFVITNPKPNTAEEAKAWLEFYRKREQNQRSG